MAELPILPLKTDALLADTSHLSTEEMGAYCRILFVMWRHDARLMDDPDELARIAGVTAKVWAKMSARVLRPMTSAGGVLSQKRLTSTWMDVQELRKKRAGAANKRWSSKSNANAPAEHKQVDEPSNANQNQIRKITTTFLEPARSKPVEMPQDLQQPAGSLASALVDGALTRQPSTEQAEPSGQPKRPSEVSRSELEAILANKAASASDLDLAIPGFLKRTA